MNAIEAKLRLEVFILRNLWPRIHEARTYFVRHARQDSIRKNGQFSSDLPLSSRP